MSSQSDAIAIDASLVRRLVAKQFPQWAKLNVKPVEFSGWDNRTFQLGNTMSVRLPSAERYAAKVAIEQKWLPRLGPCLPLPIPVPLAMGVPEFGYPWHWSIYQWIEGDDAAVGQIEDLTQFAKDVARFLIALQHIDATHGLPAGPHNFYRGGALATYDAESRNAIAALKGEIDTDAATTLWNDALESTWIRPPVWIHGDVSAGNLLVQRGRLSAVIDFGGMAVGDPACDLVIAWTIFSGASREAFRSALPLDADTWTRARGWAIWKAMITLAGNDVLSPDRKTAALSIISDLIADHANAD